MRAKPKEIKVIIAKPQKEAKVHIIKNELAELQKIVGGYIEPLTFTDDNVCIICNEEGKIDGLPLNRAMVNKEGVIWEIIAGPMIIVGDDYDNGDFIGLTDEQAEKYLKMFLKPEVFYRMNDEILNMKVEEDFWEVD